MPTRQIKGLSNFIADIRACPSRDLEERRVEREIAKIRQTFAAGKQLNGYERKKCVWKLVYISMLGYDVIFGQIEALNLISSTKYSEKVAGYIASGLLLADNDEILGLSINLVKVDLYSSNEAIAALAFNLLANVGTAQMSEILFNDVQRIANVASGSRPYIRRKAYLAMLRFARLRPEILPPNVWSTRLAQAFQSEKDIGCLISLASLILGILELHETGWQPVLHPVVQALTRFSVGDGSSCAMYNGILAPWLQIKLLRILQFFPPPVDQPDLISKVTEVIQRIVSQPPAFPRLPHQSGQPHARRTKADSERMNRSNTEHAIFFEAVNVIMAYGSGLPSTVIKAAIQTLSGISIARDGNIRCLRLAALSRLATNTEVTSSLQKQLNSIMDGLSDSDDMIRKQSLNVLFVICNRESWETVVDRLLEALRAAEPASQEEIVLKIAILVEKFAPDFSWYIDTVFTMIEYAPEAVGEPVWHRAVQMISGQNQELQLHSARKAYDSLSDRYAPEPMVRLGAYLVGEFGHLISDEASGKQQLQVLHRHFGRVSSSTKALLLLAYAKLLSAHEELTNQVMSLFDDNSQSADIEVQQRAVEMMALCRLDADQLDSILAEMPAYPVSTLRTSPLIRRLKFHDQQRALRREVLEEAALTEGQLLKPSTNKPEVQSGDEQESRNDEQHGSSDGEDSDEQESEDENEASSSSESETKNEKRSKKPSKSMPRRSTQHRHRISNNEGSRVLQLPNVDPSNTLGLFKHLRLVREGVLFSSSNLRISLRHQYKPPFGRLALEFSNTANVPIQIQSISIGQSASLQLVIAVPILDGSVIPPYSSLRQCLQVELLQPFLVPPNYVVRGLLAPPLATPILVQTALPIALTSFVTPTEITSEMFRKYWQTASQGINPQDHVIISRPSSAITSPSMFEDYLSQAFNFYSQRIVKSICGSGTLTMAAAAQGANKPLTLACLIKIDFDIETCKAMIAVRTPNLSASRHLLHLLASYLLLPIHFVPSSFATSQATPLAPSQSSTPNFPS